MKIKQMLEEALRKGEFIEFLRGENGYMIEQSEFSPGAGITDVSKILSRGIYEKYKENGYCGPACCIYLHCNYDY